MEKCLRSKTSSRVFVKCSQIALTLDVEKTGKEERKRREKKVDRIGKKRRNREKETRKNREGKETRRRRDETDHVGGGSAQRLCAKHTNRRITIMAVRVVQIRYRLEGSAARARDPLKGLAA